MSKKPVTKKHIRHLLDELGIQYSAYGERTVVPYQMDEYLSAGESRILLFFAPERDGTILRVVAPNLYKAPKKAKRRAALTETLLALNYERMIGKFEMDPRDGEVRIDCWIPVAGTLQSSVIKETLGHILTMIDSSYTPVIAAINDGEVIQLKPSGLQSLLSVLGGLEEGDVDTEKLAAELRKLKRELGAEAGETKSETKTSNKDNKRREEDGDETEGLNLDFDES